jgi:hypothetical protein
VICVFKRFGLRPSVGITGFVVAMAAVLFAGSTAAATVSGAVFTTTNPAVDNPAGTTTLCLNGGPNVNTVPAINCNIYTDKSFVWLSGGPGPSALSDGTYFFAVLVPGGQPDPNDVGAKNLSDTTSAPWPSFLFNADGSAIPSGDAYTNRTFSISSGEISYGGTHAFSNNEIRLMPYDDTTNPGGVYILAVCSLAGGDYPVVPSNCKYDAFKVLPPGQSTPPAVGLTVSKDAAGSYTNTFTWTIAKSVDNTLIKQSGTTATFTYTVSVSHDGGTISKVKVTGSIQVFNANTDNNGNTLDVTGVNVADQLSDGTVCSVPDRTNQTLTQFETDFGYECDLSNLPQGELDNTATVTWPDQQLGDGASLTGGSADFTFTNINFTKTTADDCVTVNDDLFGGTLGTACSTDPSPTTFTYSNVVAGTPGKCTAVDNTATFSTNTSQTTGSDSKSVQLCVGADLTVSKTASTAFTRTYNWSIEKLVDQTLIDIASGGTATFHYTINRAKPASRTAAGTSAERSRRPTPMTGKRLRPTSVTRSTAAASAPSPAARTCRCWPAVR